MPAPDPLPTLAPLRSRFLRIMRLGALFAIVIAAIAVVLVAKGDTTVRIHMLIATALGVWGFLLVQSCWFLVGGRAARAEDGRHPDPFEAACARAAEVLERPVG